ncbi:MAG: phosphate/phosphite/phosphonate ABC transporter substrate-binding protein [Desulfobacteraceae bacterium]|jgi:phosphonate transport system substrate-binding protein
MAVLSALSRDSSSPLSTGVRNITARLLLMILLFCSTMANAAEPLVIGIFPRRDAAITARLFRSLSRHIEQKLGIPVSMEMSPNFDTFLSNLKQRRYDLVHLNPFDYISAHDDLAYDAIVQNEEFGEATIRGAIYVRKDSGIRQLNELKGKKILFGGGPRAMMSYIVPTYLLRQAGLTKRDYEEVYAINPPNAILATYLRRADAGGAGEVARRMPVVTSKIDVNQLEVIAVSRPLPHLPWAVKQEMTAELKQRLQTLLVNLKHSEEGRKILDQARLSAFNPVTNKDYDPHRKIVEAVYGR